MIALFAGFAALSASAGEHLWTLSGTWDVPFRILCPPQPGSSCFAIGYGLWRQQDSRHWIPLPCGEHGKPNGKHCSVAVYPSDPNFLYALASNELLKSVDGGLSWSYIAPLPTGSLKQFLVSPRSSEVLYLLDTSSFLMESRDGGYSWEDLVVSGWETGTLTAVAVHPQDPSILLLGGYGKVLEFKDRRVRRTLFTYDIGGPVKEIIFADATGNRIYVPTEGGMFYRSEDGGEHWASPTRRSEGEITDLAVDPANPRHLALATTRGLFVSYDGGDTWGGNVFTCWVGELPPGGRSGI